MPTYIVRSCSYSALDGVTPKLTLVISQVLDDGKEWVRNVSLSGEAAQTLWDAYTSETEQSTIQALLAQE